YFVLLDRHVNVAWASEEERQSKIGSHVYILRIFLHRLLIPFFGLLEFIRIKICIARLYHWLAIFGFEFICYLVKFCLVFISLNLIIKITRCHLCLVVFRFLLCFFDFGGDLRARLALRLFLGCTDMPL